MCKSRVILIAIVGAFLSVVSHAQVSVINLTVPATRLETMETNVDVVIIKGTAPMGSVSANGAVVSVTCKEDTNTGTNQKEYGIMIAITPGNQPEDRTVIDYDELASLINALDYVSRVDWSVTALTGFDVFYVTRAGFRISAFSSKRKGTIQFAVRSNRMSKGIALSAVQVVEFKNLVVAAQQKLDSIRTSK